MDLSVVIVNYQTFELTKNTINSIFQYNYSFSHEIIVVDNNSSDDSLAKLQEYFKDKANQGARGPMFRAAPTKPRSPRTRPSWTASRREWCRPPCLACSCSFERLAHFIRIPIL